MARRKIQAPELIDGVPAAFLDPAADVWHDENQFRVLVHRLGLRPDVRTSRHFAICTERRRALVNAWAAANGFFITQLNCIDAARLRKLGIDDLRGYRHCPH